MLDSDLWNPKPPTPFTRDDIGYQIFDEVTLNLSTNWHRNDGVAPMLLPENFGIMKSDIPTLWKIAAKALKLCYISMIISSNLQILIDTSNDFAITKSAKEVRGEKLNQRKHCNLTTRGLLVSMYLVVVTSNTKTAVNG